MEGKVEAEACFEGKASGGIIDKTPTIVESDCYCLVEALKMSTEDKSRYIQTL
jgi:hypothetical protein